MKPLGWLGGAGVVIGTLVAVVAHFMSRTLPSTYYVGYSQLGRRVDLTLGSALVHPSWFPVLPVAMIIGLAVGLLAGGALRLVGVRGIRAVRTPAAAPPELAASPPVVG